MSESDEWVREGRRDGEASNASRTHSPSLTHRSFVRPFVRSFVRSLTPSKFDDFVDVRSLVRSFVPSFLPSFLPSLTFLRSALLRSCVL